MFDICSKGKILQECLKYYSQVAQPPILVKLYLDTVKACDTLM